MKKLILALALSLFAVDSFAVGGAAPGGANYSFFIMIIALVAVFYFFAIRPQQKQQKALRQMLANLGKGDEVITNGGVVGKVAEITEQFINLEIAANTVVKFQRQAVAKVLPKGTMKDAK